MTITIPTGGTCLLMAGAFGLPQYLPAMLGGEVTDGNVLVNVPYDNAGIFDYNVTDGRDKLDELLHSTQGMKIVFCHSLGSLAATRWLHDLGPTSDIDSAEVLFVFLGNSGRRYNGIYNGDSDIGQLLGGVLGITIALAPVDTPYKVYDLARQYDGYADVPPGTALSNLYALENTLAGANNIHPNYNNVRLDDPNNSVYVEGNITYLVSPTYPVATLQSIAWLNDYAIQEDKVLRPQIEAAYTGPVPRPAPVYPPLSGDQGTPIDPTDHDPAAVLGNIQYKCDQVRASHESIRKAKPLIRFWMNNPDGSAGLVYVGRVDYDDTIKGSFPFKNNTPTQGVVELRDDNYIAIWLKQLPNDPTLKKNVVITVDFYNGAKRWSGIMDKWNVKSKDGVKYLEVTFDDDLKFLQFIVAPPNPALPLDVFQFPRVWAQGGPAKWAVSTLLWVNLWRNESSAWTLPDDPFDINSWTAEWDMSEWQCLVKCDPFASDDSSLWTFLSSRMNPIDSVIADCLDDAQLTITYRRIITDDGETCNVNGITNVANGVLVYEIVDNSNATALEGTFLQGTIVDGMVRSVVDYTAGFVEDSFNEVIDDETLAPDEYYQSGFLGTMSVMPWVVIRDNEWTPIESSELSWGPSKNVSVIVGGDNPAIDATAKLLIETTGNLLGLFLLGFPTGTIIEDIVMPFIVGTIAAWDQWKNTGRATELGFVHYLELYQQGAENNSWSLSALTALRGGFLVGLSETDHLIALRDSWMIPGVHVDIGQRMGSTCDSKGLENIIWVNQLEEMTPSWDNSDSLQPLTWSIKAGKSNRNLTMGERMARLSKKMNEAINNIGFSIISA